MASKRRRVRLKTPPLLLDKTQSVLRRIRARVEGSFLTYWTSTSGSVCDNDVMAMHDILRDRGEQKTITLFLKSDGGSGMTSLRMVHLLRRYTKRLVVLAPLNCASAATMLALGADAIAMGPLSYLTAVDTSLEHDLSPLDHTNQLVAVSNDEVDRVIRLWKEAASSPEPARAVRRVAKALHVEWPDDMRYGDLLHTVDAQRSTTEAVFLQEAAVLFRGASYTAFDGEVPREPVHAAIAATYAHCTAPLRRLVDRYALETCLALCEERPVPGWVLEALPSLPGVMASAADRHNRLERTVIDAVEAAVLAPSVGQVSDALVIDLWKRGRGEVALRDPAVIGPCDDVQELAAEVRVRLEEADVSTRTIRFSRVRPTV